MHPDDTLPDGAVHIPLRGRGETITAYAIVDAADASEIGQYHWFARRRDGVPDYAVRHAQWPDGRFRLIGMHRQIMELLDTPVSVQVDHIDGNGLNNRRRNLRVVTHAENMQNRKIQKNNKSGIRGVHWEKSKNRWRAQAGLNGHLYRLGTFKTPEDAERAVMAWRAEHMPYAVDR